MNLYTPKEILKCKVHLRNETNPSSTGGPRARWGRGGLCVPHSSRCCPSLQPVLPEPPAHALDRRPTTGSSLVCPGLEAEMTVSDPTAWGASGPHAPALGAATQPGQCLHVSNGAASCRSLTGGQTPPAGPSLKRREKDLIKKKKKSQTTAEILYLARIARSSSIVSLAKKLCPSVGAHVPGAGACSSAVSGVTCAFPAAPIGALELQEAWWPGNRPRQAWPLPGRSAVQGRRRVCPPPPAAACPSRRPRLSCTRAALVSQESACYFYCVNKAS